MSRFSTDVDCSSSKIAVLVMAIIGQEHKFTTPNELLDRAFYLIDTGEEMPQNLSRRGTELVYFGNALESFILREAAFKIRVTKIDISQKDSIKHKSLPLMVSVDATAEGDNLKVEHDEESGLFVMDGDEMVLEGMGVIEAKNTEKYPFDSPPLELGVIQLQSQMMCTNAKWGALAVLFRGNCLRVYMFEPHKKFQELIANCAIDWHRRIKHYKKTGEKDWYDVQNSTDYTIISSIDNCSNVILNLDKKPGIPQKVNRIARIRSQVKLLKIEDDNLSMELMKEMQNHTKASTVCFDVDWGFRTTKYRPATTKVVPEVQEKTVRSKTLRVVSKQSNEEEGE